MRPVLTIAGLDPSGGAGLLADVRAFGACGVAGCAVATALTVQTGRGVRRVEPVEPGLLDEQLAAVLDDVRPAAVKIGMLGGWAQVSVVARALAGRGLPVVLDPVLASTGGVPLLDEDGRRLLLDLLLPLCTVVTPNLAELEALGGSAEALRARGAGAVLVKGGHLDGEPVDRLLDATGWTEFGGARVDTEHARGTGCALAAGLAAGLARGWDLRTAVSAAKALVADGLRAPVLAGDGRGYPGVGTRGAPRIAGLYVVTDPDLRPDRDARAIVAAALAGGARLVQLRDKHLPTPALVDLARELTALAHAHGALCLVNDRVDVALAAGADGVHLGPDDLHPADARRLLGPSAVVGVSVSSVAEAAPLAPYATYLGVGAIFGSTTKLDAGPAVGCARLREIATAFPDLPTVAIGGIGLSNIGEVAAAGADSAAVISAVVCADDMTAATAALVAAFDWGQR